LSSKNDSAFYYYIKAEKIFKEQKNQNALSGIYQDQAQVQFYTNDYLEAEKSLIKALRIAKAIKLVRKQFDIYTTLGIISHELNDYEKSLEYHLKALKVIDDFPRGYKNHCYSICFCDIGRHYLELNNPKEAKTYFEKGLKAENLIVDAPHVYAILLDRLGKSSFELKDYRFFTGFIYKSGSYQKGL
jgi:tetratricopeptide (TPR) repeat protein